MSLFDLVRGQGVSAGQLRQEIYLLGGRHRGDALAGALLELKDTELTAERRTLLRAVVRHLGRGQPIAETAARNEGGWSPIRAADLAYVAVIVGAAAWVLIVIGPFAD